MRAWHGLGLVSPAASQLAHPTVGPKPIVLRSLKLARRVLLLFGDCHARPLSLVPPRPAAAGGRHVNAGRGDRSKLAGPDPKATFRVTPTARKP